MIEEDVKWRLGEFEGCLGLMCGRIDECEG